MPAHDEFVRPLTQTNLSTYDGNCVQTAVASIVGLPLSQVPDFHAQGRAWLYELMIWCAKRGFKGRFTKNRYAIAAHRGYALVQGQTVRGTKHAVVFLNGNMVHDPHPSRHGLKSIDDAVLFN